MYYQKVKRWMDILISIGAFVFLWPIFLIIALLVRLEDGGPVVYSHERIGKNGRRFRLYKFRSMVINADDLLFSNPDLYRQMRSGTHKMSNDPRVTHIGKFIRKYSLDELPQFWNVLRGEMSFVGPRAYRPDELEGYRKDNPEDHAFLEKLLSVKPGITGLWQVNGRSTVSFEERVRMEALYSQKISLLIDLLIILKTPLAVLRAEGAS